MADPVVLVPLDGTPAALAALPVARALAEVLGAGLHVLHVSDVPPSTLPDLVASLGVDPASMEAWSLGVRAGGPAAGIVEEARARDACLVVLCTHTAGDTTSLLGSTALAVLKDAPCPLVLVPPARGNASWWPKRILLPYDGSPSANAGVGPAAALARCAKAELLVLQVGAAASAPTDPGSITLPRYVDQPQHEWPSWTGELLQRLACACKDELRARLHVRAGDPASEILRFAREEFADLILLAWKGEWIGQHACTFKALLAAAPCPLMVVRSTEAPAG